MPDFTEFMGPTRKGKILHYVGLSDPAISAGNSITFYESVRKITQEKSRINIDDSYRLFTAPGMEHW